MVISISDNFVLSFVGLKTYDIIPMLSVNFSGTTCISVTCHIGKQMISHILFKNFTKKRSGDLEEDGN